jgi:hypothetical protein
VTPAQGHETQRVVLARVQRSIGSRVAAALVALALSGFAQAAAAMPRSPGVHTCRCPKGDHDCTCPVCRAASGHRAAEPPCHRAPSKGDAGEPGPRRCISSSCSLPEAAAALQDRQVFTLPLCSPAASPVLEEVVAEPAANPLRRVTLPEVPPPRA